MPFVSITRLRVRSLWFTLPFLFDAIRSSRQAKAAEGNLAVKLLKDAHNTWWTSTAWDSEASMRKFMLSKPHGPAMRKLLNWCDEAALVHWTQTDAILPAWTEAHRRMQAEGRTSKVNHPSQAHTAFAIPAPTVRPGTDVAFKKPRLDT
jgi:heme-degrading monooxygenase HmoA